MKTHPFLIATWVLSCLLFCLLNLKPVQAQNNSLETSATSVNTIQSTDASSGDTGDSNPGSDKVFDLTFDDLKFDMEKGSKFTRSLLTPKINSYHNGTVRIRGFIRPSFRQSGLTKFIFVRDNKECCFGPGAAIYDCVLVRLKKGLETDYTIRPVTIEGKFSLKEYKGPDGNVWSIYRMSDAMLK